MFQAEECLELIYLLLAGTMSSDILTCGGCVGAGVRACTAVSKRSFIHQPHAHKVYIVFATFNTFGCHLVCEFVSPLRW